MPLGASSLTSRERNLHHLHGSSRDNIKNEKKKKTTFLTKSKITTRGWKKAVKGIGSC